MLKFSDVFSGLKWCMLLILFLNFNISCKGGGAFPFLKKGRDALIHDYNSEAVACFEKALLISSNENNIAEKAESHLYLGICYYGESPALGLEYSFKAMEDYKKLELSDPLKALEGRSRCLQLISTIKGRERKYREVIFLSREALKGFTDKNNNTEGYPGLIYSSLGIAYARINMTDSSRYFTILALRDHLKSHNFMYLPSAYTAMADIFKSAGKSNESYNLYQTALKLADSTGNRQSYVSALMGIGEWYFLFKKNYTKAEMSYQQALKIATDLNDKTFKLSALEHLFNINKQKGNYSAALYFYENIAGLKDSIYSWDRKKELKSLEIKFGVKEKDRQLSLIKKQNDIAILTNFILWGGIAVLFIFFSSVIFMLKRINNRNKQVLQVKESLIAVTEAKNILIEEQKLLKEKQMIQELDFRESQLSVMTLQMLKKNELLQELKNKLEENNYPEKDRKLEMIINRGLNQDKEWLDFNLHFESVNKQFYKRIKQAYPEISQNDLKICALIKLRLSIKEMSSILNISPDSVKTARYRLRKKLQMNNEDNLTDFIRSLE